ncbi:unnamed protein product (macronuclear) [Paramecium tetraurelia]|uniref:CBF1-interacting co-repressor CIR N-terminal domain-containing protein n=1 Tax=Paramecium tetraurelia TaxID=5888 RepID=A0BLQ7_PARTE|nr:uncharacterized protein GSPATT00030108001 [Paramecium tetraurelia]CAK59474.1 unnamed protein product [Paramecium tetraurelia]|eukprot:XP_001426872.1 hypothetical protein (macronuclear) [Paramecium tetraurelia strain d4-2]
MGLNYLQKKNWHPGSLKNQEIVWIREQIQADIIKREQERAKKLAEEKNIEELKRIQVEAGLIPKSHLDRMEWMYDVSKLEKQNQNSAEEYLLGKTATSQEVEKLADQREKAKQTQQYQTVFKEETTNAKCEDFVLVHEDPMFQIMKGEQQIKQVLLQNPLKVKQLQEKIEANKKIKKEKSHKEKKDKSKKKNGKKDKKSSKKSKKHNRSSSSRSSSSSSKEQEISTAISTGSSKSQIYQQYLKERLGNIAVTDEHGNVKADFSLMKKKYRKNLNPQQSQEELRNQMAADGQQRLQQQLKQIDEEPKQQQQGVGGGQFLNKIRKEIYNQNDSSAYQDRIKRNRHFQERFNE